MSLFISEVSQPLLGIFVLWFMMLIIRRVRERQIERSERLGLVSGSKGQPLIDSIYLNTAGTCVCLLTAAATRVFLLVTLIPL